MKAFLWVGPSQWHVEAIGIVEQLKPSYAFPAHSLSGTHPAIRIAFQFYSYTVDSSCPNSAGCITHPTLGRDPLILFRCNLFRFGPHSLLKSSVWGYKSKCSFNFYHVINEQELSHY